VSIVIQGRRVYRMVPAMKDARAQRRLAEKYRRELVEARLADLNPSGQTLEAYLRSWLRGLGDGPRPKVRPRTLEFYTMIVEQRILPTLGRTRLDRLTVRQVQAWLDAEPGAARSIHHYRAVLRRALNVALRQRIIAHNPATVAEVPDAPEYEGEPLTFDEARALLAVDDRMTALWRLAIVTGLRQGELLGLSWDDVDLDAGTVTVAGQLQRAGGSWVRTPTKAGRTLEVLAIDDATVAVLRAHQRRQAAERRPEWPYWGLVFVTPAGYPIGRSDALRLFHAACDAAGVTRRRFHDLRGSNATLLEDLDVPENVRMARLGHATKRMARKYAKPSVNQDRAAVNKLAEGLR
jgi:integrase